jgi:hypothetical protein
MWAATPAARVGFQPGPRAFPDQVALELPESAENMKDQASRGVVASFGSRPMDVLHRRSKRVVDTAFGLPSAVGFHLQESFKPAASSTNRVQKAECT